MSMEILRAQLKSGATLVSGNIKDTETLAKSISGQMLKEGRSENEASIEKDLEAKAALLETKANEIMHTGNTGYGAELVPGSILTTDFLDLAPKLNPTLASFVGFHGRNMDMKMDVPVIGELPLHQLMPEQTTGALAFVQGLGKNPTAKVSINQKEYFFSVDISEAEARFSVVDLLALIKRKLADSSARTMISAIINGDTATDANTNINLIDGTPTGTEHYLGGDGLRKAALASASTSIDLGTLAFDDFLTLRKALGENAANNEDLLYIFGTAANNKALSIDEFKQAYINGLSSSAITGKLPDFLGSSVSTQRYLGLANTAGKVSATAGNNTKGQVLLVHKAAVQYGYNGDYMVEIYRVPGKGYQVIGYYFMGFCIANSLAGTDPTVALGYNVTV